MANLTGQAPKDTYKDLLQVSNSNAGIDSTTRAVSSGAGVSATLQLSTTKTNVQSGFQLGGVDVQTVLAEIGAVTAPVSGDANKIVRVNAAGSGFQWAGFRGALAHSSATQSVPNNTATTMTVDTVDYDTDTIRSGNTLVVPTGITRVRLTACIDFAAGTANTFRSGSFLKNGSSVTASGGTSIHTAENTHQVDLTIVSPVLVVTAGDIFSVSATQISGGALNATLLSFSMEIVL